ncbi:MAG: 1-phosphofructokinase [Firmicutes bacterium GWF2_51_9]|nr:MAG: 1-phosphofructokinase [Firmicutes bacterium GWF2_51_9]OGS59066.1 MAG: 1-phosphofructokinase [Firmicutes bacterium GWE2_51_13]HAM64130.1 1-phosphofructokinase [Erysipelotrichaceae bacterium]HAO60789.1 1-phosphofructokinase [Erysipelotrichaceae bacterium]HBZ40711.1 1-phosphofructokinase [Erysipelotrichaceae bacterium]
MITTVTLNPAIDRTLYLDHFRPGEVNRVSSIIETIGGKGINVSRTLHSLGIPTRATGFIGSRNQYRVDELFHESGIDVDFATIDATTRTNTKVVDLHNRSTTDLNEPGMKVEEDQILEWIAGFDESVDSSEYVVLSGSLPVGCPSDTYRKIQNRFKGRTRFVLDADLQALCEGIDGGPYLIKPNLNELREAFDVTLADEHEIIAFSRKLIQTYGITVVLVSMGEDGGLLIMKERAYRADALKVELKSTAGAGDAMLAGCLYGLAMDLPLNDVLRVAVICGSLACSIQRGETFTRDDILAHWDEVQPTLVG